MSLLRSNTPPEVLDEAHQISMQATQPLRDAMRFGDHLDVANELMRLGKSFPEAFPEPRTGIHGEVELDGKPALLDPLDRAKFSDRVKQSSWGTKDKARVLSELNVTGKVLKIPK